MWSGRGLSELVSIVVPVYNVEKYVERCIRSLLVQSYSNIEIIIVDDGSIDKSNQVCERLSQEDSRIKLYSQPNKGVSSARNLGILHAKGKYITFVDSDDYVAEDFVKEGVSTLAEAELGVVNYQRTNVFHQNFKPSSVSKSISFNQIETLRNILYGKPFAGHPWGKFYLTEIIKNKQILFPEDLKICEDLVFCVNYVINVSRTAYSDKKYYFYYDNTGSVNYSIKKSFDKKIFDRITAINRVEQILKSYNLKKVCSRAFYYQLIFSLQRVLGYMKNCNDCTKKSELKLNLCTGCMKYLLSARDQNDSHIRLRDIIRSIVR